MTRLEDTGARLAARIAARTAHDLNNLAAVFSGHLYLLRNAAEPSQEAYEAMEKGLSHVARLTQGLTILGTLGAETPERLDLNEVARSAARAAGAPSLELNLEPGLPNLTLARADLLQAIEALITNAREASENGGPVRVTTRLDPAGSIWITVEDSGGGIPPKVLPKCLEPFFSTKGEKGRGLGLTVALLVATLHSGTLDVGLPAGGGNSGLPRLPCACSTRSLTGGLTSLGYGSKTVTAVGPAPPALRLASDSPNRSEVMIIRAGALPEVAIVAASDRNPFTVPAAFEAGMTTPACLSIRTDTVENADRVSGKAGAGRTRPVQRIPSTRLALFVTDPLFIVVLTCL